MLATLCSTHRMMQRTDRTSKLLTQLMHGCSQVITNLLEIEKPDLAVLSGDMVSGFMWDGTPGWFEKRHVQ